MPKRLTKEAKKYWKIIAPLLMGMRVLTEADGVALGEMCQKMADRDQLDDSIRASGYLLRNPKTGHIHLNPLVPTKQSMDLQIMSWLREWGLTASARTRVQTVGESTSLSAAEEMCS